MFLKSYSQADEALEHVLAVMFAVFVVYGKNEAVKIGGPGPGLLSRFSFGRHEPRQQPSWKPRAFCVFAF
jgi:hypothetical protein